MKLELLETDVDDAIHWVRNQIQKGILSTGAMILPTFALRYVRAQDLTRSGVYKRSQMPVVGEDDIPRLKESLNRVDWSRTHAERRTMNPLNLLPLQRQIYVDKALDALLHQGLSAEREFLEKHHLIVSRDHHIIDGHHRWLGALLCGEPVHVWEVQVDAQVLLQIALALSDSERHLRNA